MMMKTKITQGFEYYSENSFGHWSWYFRPIGSAFFVEVDLKKADLLEFLADPAAALPFYRQRLEKYQNVEQARLELERAKAFHAAVNQPDWDPGGSTNNPGKVARAMAEARDSKARIERAETALQRATERREAQAKAPFDYAAWEAVWLKR